MLNGQHLFLQIIKSSFIILCVATLHATVLWLISPQNLSVITQAPQPKPMTVNLITPAPQPPQISPPQKAMVASNSSPVSPLPKMTTTTIQAIKNEKPQPLSQSINQLNNTKIQQKPKPSSQIKPIKKPISKPVKASITQPLPLQSHKTIVHQAKKAKKGLKKIHRTKIAKPRLQPKKPQQKPEKHSSKIVEPPVKSSNHSTKKNQQIHTQKNNSSKAKKIKPISPPQTTKPASQKIAPQPISPHSTTHWKDRNINVTKRNRVQKDRITTRNQKTKGSKKGGKKSKRFSSVVQPQANSDKLGQGKFPKKHFANGGNGGNNKNYGIQKNINQLEENHPHKYTDRKPADMYQPIIPKTPSSPARFLSGKPPYPMISKRLGETGKVWLNVKVNVQGKAIQVKLKQSSGYRRLDQAAIKHIKQGIFQPALKNGSPVTAWQEIRLIFQLQ